MYLWLSIFLIKVVPRGFSRSLYCQKSILFEILFDKTRLKEIAEIICVQKIENFYYQKGRYNIHLIFLRAKKKHLLKAGVSIYFVTEKSIPG